MANAADENQVEERGRKSRNIEANRLAALKNVLQTRDGRDVLWWFLEEAGVHRSVWSASAMIHYNAGKQDFGHFIEARICEADEEALFQMMRDSQKLKRGDKND